MKSSQFGSDPRIFVSSGKRDVTLGNLGFVHDYPNGIDLARGWLAGEESEDEVVSAEADHAYLNTSRLGVDPSLVEGELTPFVEAPSRWRGFPHDHVEVEDLAVVGLGAAELWNEDGEMPVPHAITLSASTPAPEPSPNALFH